MNDQEHLAKFQNNARFEAQVKTLSAAYNNSFDDWWVVTCFYQAVHLVEAWCWQSGQSHSPDHLRRRAWVKQNLSHISKEYLTLESYSRAARYDRIALTAK